MGLDTKLYTGKFYTPSSFCTTRYLNRGLPFKTWVDKEESESETSHSEEVGTDLGFIALYLRPSYTF